MRLKILQESDLPFLLEIRNDASTRINLENDSIFNLKQCKKWFKTLTSPWYIIEVNKEYVGYIRTDGDWVGADIHPNHRRKGYARKAYREYLKDKTRAQLEVFEDNFAINLYKELGFVEVSHKYIRDRKYIRMLYRYQYRNNFETNKLLSETPSDCEYAESHFILGDNISIEDFAVARDPYLGVSRCNKKTRRQIARKLRMEYLREMERIRKDRIEKMEKYSRGFIYHTNYIVSLYNGPRRSWINSRKGYGDTYDMYLPQHIKFLNKKPKNIDIVTFVINRSNPSIDRLTIEYIEKNIDPSYTTHIITRENSGFSYGAWQEGILNNNHHTLCKYSFLIEDDYIPSSLDFISKFVENGMDDITTAFSACWWTHSTFPPHAAISNGLLSNVTIQPVLSMSNGEKLRHHLDETLVDTGVKFPDVSKDIFKIRGGNNYSVGVYNQTHFLDYFYKCKKPELKFTSMHHNYSVPFWQYKFELDPLTREDLKKGNGKLVEHGQEEKEEIIIPIAVNKKVNATLENNK